MTHRCVSSQWAITVSQNSVVHQYDVNIMFGRPENFDNVDNERGVKNLSKSNNANHKSICRHIVQGLHELDGITHVYNDRAILLTNKLLKNDNIKFTTAQPNLDDFLKRILVNHECILKVFITKAKTVKLCEFPTDAALTLQEDRTWRTMVEMILSEDALTRNVDKYISIGDGKLCENNYTHFNLGLIYRKGVKKGVEVANLSNCPQLTLTMDYCAKVLYPGRITFLELIQTFMAAGNNYQDAEIFFKGVKLCPTYDRSRILTFCKFTETSIRHLKTQDGRPLEQYFRSFNTPLYHCDEPAAVTSGSGYFPLELLEVLSNQPISIAKMPGSIKEEALNLNRLIPNKRYDVIQRQFQKLSFNNHITSAFGIKIDPRMLEGEYQRLEPMKMILHRNTVKCNEQSAFNFGRNMYFKAAGFSKIVVFATRRDQKISMECAIKIGEEGRKKGMQMPNPICKEFDTSSERLNEWIRALKESNGAKTLAIIVDKNEESHPIVKLAEALAGVQTQHLFFDTALKVARGRPQTLENIVHKLNVKAGGINHLVDFGPNLKKIKLAESLIISMDVSHPGKCSESGEEPSTVGLVGNYFADPNEYAGLFFYQPPRQETIEPRFLEIYVKKMLHQAQKCGRSIKNVIVLRDGISEGQYSMFIEKEMDAIIQATSEISAKYLGMIVTKDGITRHFMDISNGIQNMPPRSFVSFGCRFGFNQMYMVAHNSSLGTAKTVMITVLRDDLGVPTVELQTFLLGLNQLHQIVAAPISLPAPLQQADSLAEHGQKIFRAMKKYAERDIPRNNDDAVIDYFELSNLLNFSNGNLPFTRYTA